MRNILKATTVENKLPLLAVENGCIVSKDADITVCYEVTLPELYTVTSAEYEDVCTDSRDSAAFISRSFYLERKSFIGIFVNPVSNALYIYLAPMEV